MVDEKDYLEVEQDLIGGIDSGVSRGQSLKESMISLYNAGYEKENIERAAKTYLDLVNKRKILDVDFSLNKDSDISTEIKKEEGSDIKKKTLFLTSPSTKEKPSAPQTVSSYGEDKKIKQKMTFSKNTFEGKNKDELRGKIATYLLIAILIFLLIALATVFLFKDELVRFINNMFG
jgi:hypothetical protein